MYLLGIIPSRKTITYTLLKMSIVCRPHPPIRRNFRLIIDVNCSLPLVCHLIRLPQYTHMIVRHTMEIILMTVSPLRLYYLTIIPLILWYVAPQVILSCLKILTALVGTHVLLRRPSTIMIGFQSDMKDMQLNSTATAFRNREPQHVLLLSIRRMLSHYIRTGLNVQIQVIQSHIRHLLLFE